MRCNFFTFFKISIWKGKFYICQVVRHEVAANLNKIHLDRNWPVNMNGDSYLVLDYSTYRRQLKAKRVSEDITNAVQNVDCN